MASANKRYPHNLRILLDSGSQLSFISQKARQTLKLLTISKHKIDVKTLSNASNAKDLYLVQVAAKSKGSLLNIYVNVFINDICLPVEKQNIEFVRYKYPHQPGKFNFRNRHFNWNSGLLEFY